MCALGRALRNRSTLEYFRTERNHSILLPRHPPPVERIGEQDPARKHSTLSVGSLAVIFCLFCYLRPGEFCVYIYDTWGNPVSITGSMASTVGNINPFRYRSCYHDTESGLYYLNARYYNPEWGRFISIDPVLDTSPRSGGGTKGLLGGKLAEKTISYFKEAF